MITQTVTVKEKGDQNIIIGRRGTYETEQIVFDVTYLVETFGDGVAMLMVKRPSDTYAYPATVERDGNNVIWTVSEVDTGVKGHGECELFWYVNDATGLAKSVIYSVAILRDIAETYTDPPEAWETWIDQMAELSAETMAYAEDAVDAAADALEAKADAVDAKDAAVIAQGAAETAAENAQSAVSHYPKIEGGYWHVWTNGEWVNTGVKAEGVDGKGIVSVVGEKTSTSGLVDTYTMTVTYTDNMHSTITFTVTNGKDGTDGTDGTDGVSPTVTITQITGGHTVTITDANHPSGQSFDVMDGEVTNAVLNAALQTKAPIIKDTATGTIATFPDGTPGPMKIEATLTPIQDLHGQEAPWPPGGGKNKLPSSLSLLKERNTGGTWSDNVYSVNGLSLKVNDDLSITISGTATAQTYFTFVKNNSGIPFEAGSYVVHKTDDNNVGVSVVKNGSYWFEARTTDAVNTLEESANLSFYLYVKNSTSFSTPLTVYPMFESGSTASAYAPYSNECPIGGHTGADVYVEDEYDAQATPTVTISFDQTVYGGNLVVNEDGTGSVVAEYVYGDLANATLYRDNTSYKVWRKQFTSEYAAQTVYGGDYAKCNITNSFGNVSSTALETKIQFPTNPNRLIFASIPADVDPATVNFCYELATPITIPLTPRAIDALQGANTVWVDAATGAITVQYPCDTKLYIDKKIAALAA